MCRISASKSSNADIITYAGLVDRARASFKFDANDTLAFTYTDCDGDVINLASDQDIMDALVYQDLNPLRVDLTVVKGVESAPPPAPAAATAAPAAAATGATGAAAVAENWDADSVKTDSSEAPSAAEEAGKGKGAAAPTPTATPTPAADSVKEVTDLVEKQLREALGVSEEVGKLMKTYEPLLRTAPGKIAEIFDAALKSGLSVSFEPVFEPGSNATPPSAKSGAERASANAADAAKATPAVPAGGSSGDTKGTPAGSSREESVPKTAKGTAPGAPSSAVADAVASAAAAVASTAAAVASARKSAAAAAETAAKAASAASTAGAGSGPVSYPVVHHGIICDGCDMNPLVGPRYKSLV